MHDLQATGKSDVSAPPVSKHFDDSDKIHPPKPSNIPPAAPQSAEATGHPPQYPALHATTAMPNPYYPSQYPPTALLPPYFALYSQVYPPYPMPVHAYHQSLPLRTSSNASSSPGKTTSHNVSLAEFCAKYSISKTDHDKLAAMEYRPGDPGVESLPPEEWREIGKFTILHWQGFLKVHKAFCTAIKNGTWA
jgi:hypothetical protein